MLIFWNASEQEHLGLQSSEAFQHPTHLDEKLPVMVQRRSERPHR